MFWDYGGPSAPAPAATGKVNGAHAAKAPAPQQQQQQQQGAKANGVPTPREAAAGKPQQRQQAGAAGGASGAQRREEPAEEPFAGTPMSPEFEVCAPRLPLVWSWSACRCRWLAHKRSGFTGEDMHLWDVWRPCARLAEQRWEQGWLEHRLGREGTLVLRAQSWCRERMMALQGNADLTLVQFLMSCSSVGEVAEYVTTYLGKGAEVSQFTSEFLRRKYAEASGKKVRAPGLAPWCCALARAPSGVHARHSSADLRLPLGDA